MSKSKYHRPEKGAAPPPKYGSRKVQVRLLLLVFLFMGVLMMMDRARDPKLYSWMGFENADGTPTELDDTYLDTRLKLQPAREAETAIVIANGVPQVDLELGAGTDVDLVGNVLLDAWAKHLEQLSRDNTWVLFRVLKHVRGDSELSDDDLSEWPGVIAQLDVAWSQYVDDARTAINAPESSMAEGEKKQWNELLGTIEKNWNDQVEPAFDAVSREQPLTDSQQLLMQRISAQIDAVCMSKVRDDDFLLAREFPAWFRLLDDLRTRSQDDIVASSTDSPSYTGLFRQPEIYRGKLVTVKGTAKRALWVHAPKNAYDIEGYYQIWIQPANGPKSPISVYSLEIPDGFPLSDRENLSENLDEDVQFTGYFFKRYAYRARDGANTVPQLLAKTPRWTPQSNSIWETRSVQLPGFLRSVAILWLVSALAAGAAFIAVGIAVVAYRRSTWKNEAMERAEGYSRSQVERIDDVTKGVPLKDVKDKLNDLSQQMRDE